MNEMEKYLQDAGEKQREYEKGMMSKFDVDPEKDGIIHNPYEKSVYSITGESKSLYLTYYDDGGQIYVMLSGFVSPQRYIIVFEDPYEELTVEHGTKEDVLKLGFTEDQINSL